MLELKIYAIYSIIRASILAQKYQLLVSFLVALVCSYFTSSIFFGILIFVNLLNIFVLPILSHELFHMLIIVLFYFESLIKIQFKFMHIDIVYEVQYPRQSLFVSLAGVLINLVLAIVFGILARLQYSEMVGIFYLFASISNFIVFAGSISPTSSDGRLIFQNFSKNLL